MYEYGDILTIKNVCVPLFTFVSNINKCKQILYIKMLRFFVCLSELSEELVSRRDTKIGM